MRFDGYPTGDFPWKKKHVTKQGGEKPVEATGSIKEKVGKAECSVNQVVQGMSSTVGRSFASVSFQVKASEHVYQSKVSARRGYISVTQIMTSNRFFI